VITLIAAFLINVATFLIARHHGRSVEKQIKRMDALREEDAETTTAYRLKKLESRVDSAYLNDSMMRSRMALLENKVHLLEKHLQGRKGSE